MLDGQAIDGLYVINTSQHMCTVGGYPRVALYDAAGREIGLKQVDGGGLFGDPSAVAKIFPLKAHDAIGFNIQAVARNTSGSNPVVGRGCWTATIIKLRLPEEHAVTGHATTDSAGFTGCGTTFRVSAFYPPVFANIS